MAPTQVSRQIYLAVFVPKRKGRGESFCFSQWDDATFRCFAPAPNFEL